MMRKMGSSGQFFRIGLCFFTIVEDVVDEILDLGTVGSPVDIDIVELALLRRRTHARPACWVCLRVTLLGGDTNILALVMVRSEATERRAIEPRRGLHLSSL